ncbi:hypothetical protein FBU30_010029 [Linnemannia zychae]|nr:hypothetical protein FBU30_010029 [Linnemannia zychae]
MPDQHHTRHVIFVVHGMGRQLEVPFGNYERNVSHLVENTRTVLQSQFHDLDTDVHIIPIEWHAKLHSMVDERMALASLRTVPKVRLVMNDYMADILYYFNPHFGTQIVKMIVDELNEAYDTFLEKHPDFNGKISVYALSLGGVAMFDILTCQDDDDLEDATESSVLLHHQESTPSEEYQDVQEPPAKKARVRKQDQPKFRAVIPKLKFRPEYLFTVGSPVGAVMVMRNLDWETFHPPEDIIHHNIFHPFDPLGYRLEPLIDPIFAGVPASVISSYQSQLFPSLSLPSLPSLLPEAIASFWENRVPTLPRPSIPTLSSISLMTQSLKAGRWLSGSGSTRTEDDEGSSSTSTDESDDNSDDDEQRRAGNIATGSETTPVSSDCDTGDLQEDRKPAQDKAKRWNRESMILDGDGPVSEFMGAATAATYLEQAEDSSSNSRANITGLTDAAAIKAQNDTTTESPQTGGHHPPTRRPSLGPRRISSRIEDERDIAAAVAAASGMKRTMQDVAEETEFRAGNREGDSLNGNAQEKREKALGAGAKSDVVQESIVRSMPNESTSAAESIKTDVEEPAASTTTSAKKTVHVEGKATKLPYRIDHVLQETTVDQYTNEYLLGMRSHFKYWANRDVAYHILKTMLEPKDSTGEDEILDLKLSIPIPVSTVDPAKEAADAKAKATAMAASSSSSRARSGTMGSTTSDGAETKRQNRMSFNFSFFGGQSNSSSEDVLQQGQHADEQERLRKRLQRQKRDEEEEEQQSAADEDLGMMNEEDELFGYRYSESGSKWKGSSGSISSIKTTRGTTKTLFQNSPWAIKRTGEDIEVETAEATTYMTRTSATATLTSRSSRRISLERRESSVTTTSIVTSTKGKEEEVVEVDVPELARPAKLHHRAARVEE